MNPQKNSEGFHRALLGAGFCVIGLLLNRFIPIEVAFGISLLAGNIFGVLAALTLPWPFNALGPLITMLPTLVVWGHPGALASVFIEGLAIAFLVRKGKIQTILLFEPLYWLLVGSPLVFVQYRLFLGFPASGALAAAAKQGANAAICAVGGVLGYYFLVYLHRNSESSRLRRSAQEIILLFLDAVMFLPLVLGFALYSKNQANDTIVSATREISITAGIVLDEVNGKNNIAHLQSLLDSTGHSITFVPANGSEGWQYPEQQVRLDKHRETVMYQSADTVLIADALELNPMLQWRTTVIRKVLATLDGDTILIEGSFAPFLDAFSDITTLMFGVGLVWLSLASMAAYRVSSILVRPLESLRKAAETMQRGGGVPDWPAISVTEINELRDSLVAMTGALMQRESELGEARVKAEELTKKSEHYLAFMGHELKSPLTALSSTIDDLIEEPAGCTDFLGTAKDSLGKLIGLIDDILDQSRTRSGRLKLRSELFIPAVEARRLLEPFAIQSRRLGLDFSLQTDEVAELAVMGDSTRFRQILANLTSNAIKYTKAGSVAVQLSGGQKPGRVEITGSVSDTGIGIEHDRRNEIWEPFASRSTGYAGGLSSHGLGLSIVRGIIESMDGTVTMDSTPGKGTRFTFMLPFCTAEAATMATTPENEAGGSESEPDLREIDALIADDERLSRMVVARLLRQWGARVVEVENGTQAIQKCLDSVYGLVILDENMPGSSGTDVARMLMERQGSGVQTFVILASADTEAGHDLDAGIAAFMPKPISQELLRMVLSKRFPASMA